MKKILAILMSLSVLFAAVPGLGEVEPLPSFDDMPKVIVESDDVKVDEAAFFGTWHIDKAFVGTEYITVDVLLNEYRYVDDELRITKGIVSIDDTDDDGNPVVLELPYTFEAGQLRFEYEPDQESFVAELLEDNNIVLSVFKPGKGDETICISIFFVRVAD